MDGPDENQIRLKKEIIQAEIIDKKYDTEKFFAFCLKKKENGDDLANWSLLELNDVINDFISQINAENAANESLDGEKTVNINKETKVEDKKDSHAKENSEGGEGKIRHGEKQNSKQAIEYGKNDVADFCGFHGEN